MRHVGIDVSAQSLCVVYRDGDKVSGAVDFANTPEGHEHLIKHMKSKVKGQDIRVCLEATGVYHFDCAVLLSKTPGIEVMVINPKASKHFANALMQRGKTDPVDANMLSCFCQRMDFIPWCCPDEMVLKLRCFGRKLTSFSEFKTQLKNQRHALSRYAHTPQEVCQSQQDTIAMIEQQIEILKQAALALVKAEAELARPFQLLLSCKGIAELSAIQILGEILVLADDMEAKQWVAHSGLNPVTYQSGSSVNKRARISKVGNRQLRRALYMPAMTAAQCDPYVRGYYWHLINDRGLKKRQAICAIMRKMLHAIHAMFETNQPFDNTRFYKTPLAKADVPVKAKKSSIAA